MTKSVAYTQPINPILVSNPVVKIRGITIGEASSNFYYGANILLLGIAGLLLFFYIIQANVIAADKYKIKILNEKLTSLNEFETSLAVQKSEAENPSELMEFARSRNMVEAKNITYLFENGNVALKQ